MFIKKFIILFVAIQALYAKEDNPLKYRLSVCAIFKNEEKFLKEWIEYHRLIGVEHFYLYDMQSTDRSCLQLQKYIRSGIVTLTSWPSLSPMIDSQAELSASSLGICIPAYEHAAKYLALFETKWLIFLDINEYLLPGDGFSLESILNKYADYPGIDLFTEFFDASKIDPIPARKLLIQTAELAKAIPKHPFKEIKKTIFKPEFYAKFSWPPYKPLFKDDQKPATTPKREMRINQYAHRFNGTIFNNKTIGKAHVDNRYMSEQEIAALLDLGYEIEDETRDIFRFIPELLKKMDANEIR